MGTTATSLQTDGGVGYQVVVCIEGVSILLTDGPTAAVATAWADWTGTVHGGLSVQWAGGQSIKPWSAALPVTNLSFAVMDADGLDTFGKLVGGTNAGVETTLTQSMNTTGSIINVRSTTGFDAAGFIHVGTERIQYTSVNATQFRGCTRGLSVPFTRTASAEWGRMHTIPRNTDGTRLPVRVTSLPRIWAGRWVGVWIHRRVGGTLDVKAQAELVWAGRIVATADTESGETSVECESATGALRDCLLMRDQYQADIKEGYVLRSGGTFTAGSSVGTTTVLNANPLTVVPSGASGANQVDAGIYTAEEMATVFNRWFASEYAATRLAHRITAGLGQNDAGVTSFQFRFTHSAVAIQAFRFSTTAPRFMWFIGWGIDTVFDNWSPATHVVKSPGVPLRRVLDWSFVTGITTVHLTAERGSFFNNASTFPPEVPSAGVLVTPANPAVAPVDLQVGTEETYYPPNGIGVFRLSTGGCFLANKTGTTLQLLDPGAFVEAMDGVRGIAGFEQLYGVTVDDDGDMITVSQVAVFGGSLLTTMLRLLSSTGTSNYNNGTYDVLGEQNGAAIPYELLSTGFATDVQNLSVSSYPLIVVIAKPTKLTEVIGCELAARASTIVFKSGGLRLATWGVPTASTALHNLTEAKKAEAEGNMSGQRTPSEETDDFVCTELTIKYNRSLSAGSSDGADSYRSTYTIKDRAAQGDTGTSRQVTIGMRNTYAGEGMSEANIDTVIGFLAGLMPMFSRPLRTLRRSIDMSLYTGVGPGDQVTLTDLFARDTSTGARGFTGKPGLIVSHVAKYIGRDNAPMVGEVDIVMFPRDRVAPYSPCAQIASYVAGTRVATCGASEHSEAIQASDVSHFDVADAVRWVEIDPVDPGAPGTGLDVVAARDTAANTITLTTGITGYTAAKTYRIISAGYTTAATTQKTDVYQADDADGLIADLAQPYEYGWQTNLVATYTEDVTSAKRVELWATASSGDGVPLDTGYERSVCRLANNLASYRTAPRNPTLVRSVMQPAGSCIRTIVYRAPYCIGPGDLMNGTRLIYLAPWYRSATGSLATVRISLCRRPPIGTGLVLTNTLQPEYVLVGPYESSDWSTASTTWGQGAAYGFTITSLHPGTGKGWIVIEATQDAQCRGPSKLYAGPYVE